ncbi:MAG TPA: hypothetical protein ENI44_05480 [Thermoplasmatales archaeon]|nr:hypothetical protein [Thermoplasmatales archaeon]
MKPYYKRLRSVKYLASMGRTIIFMKIKQMTPDGVANHLKTHPADAELLGYERNQMEHLKHQMAKPLDTI